MLRKALITMTICDMIWLEVIRSSREKSLDFATKIVSFYKDYSKTKKDTTIAKQLLHFATSIGGDINEAIYGNSKTDFLSTLHISLKETGESIYWLTLLNKTKLTDYDFDSLLPLAEEINECLSPR